MLSMPRWIQALKRKSNKVIERPRYKLVGQFHSDELGLLPPGVEIVFDGEPNEAMQPINESAKKNMQKFRCIKRKFAI